MRFHKFTTRQGGDIWVDLDQVHAVRGGGKCTEILMHAWTHVVDLEVADVLALISPPTAPDTYEEELGARIGTIRNKVPDHLGDASDKIVTAQEQLKRVVEAIRAAEQGSLMQEDVSAAFAGAGADIKAIRVSYPEAMSVTDRRARIDELARLERAVYREFGTATNWTTEYIERRRAEIEQGA